MDNYKNYIIKNVNRLPLCDKKLIFFMIMTSECYKLVKDKDLFFSMSEGTNVNLELLNNNCIRDIYDFINNKINTIV